MPKGCVSAVPQSCSGKKNTQRPSTIIMDKHSVRRHRCTKVQRTLDFTVSAGTTTRSDQDGPSSARAGDRESPYSTVPSTRAHRAPSTISTTRSMLPPAALDLPGSTRRLDSHADTGRSVASRQHTVRQLRRQRTVGKTSGHSGRVMVRHPYELRAPHTQTEVEVLGARHKKPRHTRVTTSQRKPPTDSPARHAERSCSATMPLSVRMLQHANSSGSLLTRRHNNSSGSLLTQQDAQPKHAMRVRVRPATARTRAPKIRDSATRRRRGSTHLLPYANA